MENMERKILVLPDIHCRSFWKEPLEHIDEYNKVVVLGDYFDPYPYEGLTIENGFKNLEELIKIKKENKEKVVLLLGNHDCHYINGAGAGSRYNRIWAPKFKNLFKENIDLFDIATEANIGKVRYFFSHAGVLKGWLEDHSKLFNLKEGDELPKAEVFNNLFKSDDKPTKDRFMSALTDVGPSRWGNARNGSMVWADVDDHKFWENNPNFFDGVYQVFGHSQQVKYPVITEHYACLDCRKAFVIDVEGIILDYETGQEVEGINNA